MARWHAVAAALGALAVQACTTPATMTDARLTPVVVLATLVVSNDDDFGITSSDGGGQVLRKINPLTGHPDFGELRFVRLGNAVRP